MKNSNKVEKDFSTYLQKQFSKNDLIRLNESFVPRRSSNRVNRFYSSNDSIWFSRLKVSEKEKIYYFGIMDNPFPKAIVRYHTDYLKSLILFSKNEEVYLKVKIEDSNILTEINHLFTLKYASNDKSSNFYFLQLGKINSHKLINNIKILLTRFSFTVSLNRKSLFITNYIYNPSYVEIGEVVDKVNYIDTLKLNIKVIQIENILLKYNFPYGVSKRLKEFLFRQTSTDDYILNPKFKNKFNLNDSEIFGALQDIIPKIDNSLSYESILEKIILAIREYDDSRDVEDEYKDDSLSELEKMKIVLRAIRNDKSEDEAAELAGISEDKIFEWYEDGDNSVSENTIYFFNKLNEILSVPTQNDEATEQSVSTDDILQNDFNEDSDDDLEHSIPEDYISQDEDISEPIGIIENPQDDTEKITNGKIYNFNSSLFNPGTDIYQEVKAKFPLEIPRPDQLEITSEVAYAINKGYKYIFIEAGTGTGKSAIAATLARIYESSYILTVTKQLQNQYFKDFKKYGFELVKGRQNFGCIHHKDITCDKGDCVLKNKSCDYNLTGSNPLDKLEVACDGYFWKSDVHCPYWIQKVDALNSKVAIANYDFGLYDFNLSRFFKKRRLLILDEAHNLENKIMSFISLDLNRKTLIKDIGLNLDFNTIDKLQKGSAYDWINFVKNVKDKYDARAKSLISKAKANGEDEGFIKDLEKDLKIESANRERFIEYIGNDKNNWICDYDNRNEIISFKPLSVKNYTHDYLFNFGDVCIFLSATILNHKKFAEWMGIDINKVYSIKRDSPFNSKDNPIIVTDSFNMSRGYLKDSAPKTIPVINEILNKHKNEKGLIHTVSKDCRRYIMRNINNDRLMTHTTKNRNKQLEEYKSSKNSVLVSPSMSEGVDLPGEQCRFQIIYKLPFMKLSEQVRKRVKDDEEWYDYRTCIALVQTFGRGIRFEGDYCTTYVIDKRFIDFIRKDKKQNQFIPDYVLKAIK